MNGHVIFLRALRRIAIDTGETARLMITNILDGHDLYLHEDGSIRPD